jgi:SAM-dependent methyltransferase
MRWDRFFGPVAPELGWVPPPSFLLRRDRILRALSAIAPSRVLEVGSGAGALATELSKRGFSFVAFETSPKGRETTQSLASAAGVDIEVVDHSEDNWTAAFPMLMAFEVLEHIEGDEETLLTWREWLAPGGTLLLSVPAHASKWGAGDVWAGHFRRYERDGLRALLARTGYRVEKLETWGFPAGNLLLPISNRVYRRRLDAQPAPVSKAQASAESGVERQTHVRLAWLLINPLSALVLRLLFWLQGLFANRDLGVGYLVVAKKV